MKAREFILGIALCLASPMHVYCTETTNNAGSVASCMDGDTLQLVDRRVIRLAGIDSPEKPRGGKNAQYFSRQARKTLEDLVKGQQVTIVSPGVKPKDIYGRHLAELYLPDGTSINEKMVSLGAAFYFPHPDLNPEYQERLAKCQEEAIKEKRGFWEHILELPLAEYQYIGDSEILRFYPVDCSATQNIKPRNRIMFDNLMDAFLAGYAPARICVFWPDEVN